MLELKNLEVQVAEKKILKGINLTVAAGEIHALMGSNGSGKSTIANVIMGHPDYKVVSGSILFNGEDITELATNERADKGLFLVFQSPRTIDGIHGKQYLQTLLSEKILKTHGKTMKEARADEELKSQVSPRTLRKEAEGIAGDFSISKEMLSRSLNEGFSGGEKKKMELTQLRVRKPSFIILDELDSGVDVDALKLMCEELSTYARENNCAMIVITHYPRILEYLPPQAVHMCMSGKIVRSGDMQLAYDIEKSGFAGQEITQN